MARKSLVYARPLLLRVLPALALAPALILPGPALAAEVLGQVASSGLRVEGVSAPSGTTLISPILLATDAEPGLVYLSNGRTLAIGPHTEVSLASVSGPQPGLVDTVDRLDELDQVQPIDRVKVAVHRGLVAYRGDDGEIVSVGRADAVYLDQEQVIGEGRRIAGLVAVLTATAAAGDSALRVDSTDRVDPDRKSVV